ncbi:cell wall-binding repeat-containing protein [Dactylosporangium aurantiacum]|uniref:Cell wall-binding repeat-containing protein n=1 Tax=Dactylosporangium aurantiacum TaxID=35754 RepID=A0A9Q9IG41_9ACTN|nr:cell wall-binding repeat-containing protein [Dactylosporangium aurantiacum]MDG6100860.1 cell wall-binding repeat-containing protein [Dactylosporangium aurantiacum]UWZ55081.1 cell wall-binding repeat-containing protein [Dactylosporangium aurantiacum]
MRRLAVGGVVLASVAATATGADAAHQGEVGKLTYNVGSTVYVANQDGSGATVLATGVNGNGAWSPDGSRFVYAATDGGIKTVRQYGGTPLNLTDPQAGVATDPTWSARGRWIYFSRNGQLWSTSSDGTFWEAPLNENPGGFVDVNPSASDDGDIIFERSGAVYKYNAGSPGSPTKLVDAATDPDFAPGGGRFVYVSAGNLWVADSDGGNKTQLTTEGGASSPAFSADGASVVYASGNAVKKVDVASKQSATVKDNGSAPTSQGVRRNVVQRIWGADGTGTAIATSQWNYLDLGNPNGSDEQGRVHAHAVVLSRSDTYLDALVGSALAISKQAPLLITAPGSTVEPRVLDEIKRILGSNSDIYLLGGTLALPAGIETQLRNLGYQVHRLWGNTHYDTAIEINKQITPDPRTAIVTTGANYYDALAAGAATGPNPGTVIVLTDGVNMPAASANYLNGLNPDYEHGGTAIVTAGGPGNTALQYAYLRGQLPAWGDAWGYWPLVGDNEKDTAVQLAQFFFASPLSVALATNRGWQDALTGGAMIGAADGPLLLVDNTGGLYGPVATYLSEGAGSISHAVMLGGYLALPDNLAPTVGDAIAVAGQFDFIDGQIAVAGNGLRGQTATPTTGADTVVTNAKVPGLTTVAPTTVK